MTTPFRIRLEGAVIAGETRDGTDNHLPLVLVHGFGGSQRDWGPLIQALSPSRPLITFDQRGFGTSEGKAGLPFSHAEDLLAVLDAQSIAQVDLCGMSLGGATVLNFALTYPERVRRLILISPLMVGWTWTSEWVDLWKEIGRAARAGDMDKARELWFQHPLFDTTRASPAVAYLHDSIAAFHGRQWVQDDQAPTLPDIDRITMLNMPTLLLTGAQDTPDFRLIADVIDTMGQDVTRIDYLGAGHMLNLEIPVTIGAEIEAFL